MKICIDITEMLKTPYVSGIQRVVREVTTRWIAAGKEVTLLAYDAVNVCFKVVDNRKYYDQYTGKSKSGDIFSGRIMKFSDFNREHIFFDMDSVWMTPLKRTYLLPILKKRGTKIVAHIYDIIPVTEPQYCHELTVVNFLEYISAQLMYSNLIIANAQATLDAIDNVIKGTTCKRINGSVVKLGSDIAKNAGAVDARTQVQDIAGRGKYVLMVGTIEPRKNHKYVLSAFEKGLFDKGINLVFAGKVGWNVEEFVEYIKNHEKYNSQLFFIDDATDADIACLYRKSLLVAFPSYNEGFELPIIEAFGREALVVASDIPVLRETGGEYCKYFSLEREQEFNDLVELYAENEEVYTSDKQRISEFRNNTWDMCAQEMYDTLQSKV